MQPPPQPPRREHRRAAVFSVGFLLVVLSPVAENWKEDPHDGFPLSYYPMFSHARDQDQDVTHLAARMDDGSLQPLSYRLAGTGGFNQVRRQIRRAVRDGRAEALCTAVAERLAGRIADGEAGPAAEVVVLTSTFGLDAYFTGDRRPRLREVHATCPLPTNPS